MQRRKFLHISGYAGAGLGITTPTLASLRDRNQPTALADPDKAAADRLLLNLIQHGAGSLSAPAVALLGNFESQLREIGYSN